MSKEGKLLKNSAGVSLATLASRITGLVRVKLEAMALGGGSTATIWAITLMLPNLSRRLLGEGALGTALTPVVAENERAYGIETVRLQLAQILCLLGAVLALIVIIISGGAYFLGSWAEKFGSEFLKSDRVLGVCELLPLIMPYAFFICLTGVIGAVLNYSGIFVRPALTALLFNFCMIGGLLAGVFFDLSPVKLLTLLALLTPAAGAVQLVLMLWMLRCCGRFPRFCRRAFESLAFVKKVVKLAVPGILSYGVLQFSFLLDRTFALYLGDQAVPALSYVDRIIDLPIGLFAVSLGSVLMASMTHAAADNDRQAMSDQLNFSLRHVWFIGAPMAAAVMFFHPEIISVICLGGKYTRSDLDAARMVAVFYGMGIPFFCSLKVLLPAFYSRKDMKRPLKVSCIAFFVNLICNLLLMFPLQQGGIALATVISSMVNNTLLLLYLYRDGLKVKRHTLFCVVRSVIIAGISAFAVWLILPYLQKLLLVPSQFLSDLLILVAVGMLFGIFFALLAFICRSPELREFFSILRRKKKKSA